MSEEYDTEGQHQHYLVTLGIATEVVDPDDA
jgi:hypothetical protein